MRHSDQLPSTLSTFSRVGVVSTREHVVEHLASAMLEVDEALWLVRPDAESINARDTQQIRWIEHDLQHIYDRVNDLMQRLTD